MTALPSITTREVLLAVTLAVALVTTAGVVAAFVKAQWNPQPEDVASAADSPPPAAAEATTPVFLPAPVPEHPWWAESTEERTGPALWEQVAPARDGGQPWETFEFPAFTWKVTP